MQPPSATDVEIWHVGPGSDRRGGIVHVIHTLIQAQSAAWPGRVHWLSTSTDGGPLVKFISFATACVRLVALLLRRRDRILLHVHTSHGNSLARKRVLLRIARLFSTPVVLQVHSGLLAEQIATQGPASHPLTVAAGGARVLLGLTSDLAPAAVAAGIPFHLVFNAVEPPPTDGLSGPDASEPTLLFLAGRGLREKGAYTLLEALAALPPDRPYRCVIAGPDPMDELRQEARRLGIAGRIEWAGWVDGEEKANLLRRADLFVLPSLREGLPIALLEAMAWGLPCVATPVGGIPRLIASDDVGWLVPAGDAGALSVAIDRLLSDPVLRTTLGTAARRTMMESCTPAVVARSLEAIYRQALGGGDPR
ncbi:MAG: glycosyltransferase family 4 protein [Acidobacteriota bacterium]|nr:glycosyltransferase family 4 protein [Acidobacteriota bacterium]